MPLEVRQDWLAKVKEDVVEPGPPPYNNGTLGSRFSFDDLPRPTRHTQTERRASLLSSLSRLFRTWSIYSANHSRLASRTELADTVMSATGPLPFAVQVSFSRVMITPVTLKCSDKCAGPNGPVIRIKCTRAR